MREIIVATFVSLDGVMQAPGGPEEDTSGGFRHGGWTVPFFDEVVGQSIGESFAQPFDLLLGRRTYDIFAAHWPHVNTDPAAPGYEPGDAEISQLFNRIRKYVATHAPETLAWENSEGLGPDIVGRLRDLKDSEGPNLVVQGSSELIHQLLANDLVDEMRLLVFPVILGQGKKLFGPDAVPASLKLTGSVSSPSGVVVASYRRAGAVQTGSFALSEPTPAEIERRKSLS